MSEVKNAIALFIISIFKDDSFCSKFKISSDYNFQN